MNRPTALLIALLVMCLATPYARAEPAVLSWKECVARSRANHPDLISAAEDITQAGAQKDIARSDLLPAIDSSVAVSTGKSAGRQKTAKIYSYGVTASQLLFDASKNAEEVKAEAENVKAAGEAFRFTSSAVRLRLRTAFINVFRAQELAYLAKEIFEIRRNNLELITLRYQSGLEHRGALLTAEANLAQARLEIARAGRDLEVAQRQLSKEMGSARFEPMLVHGEFELSVEEEKPDFEAIALKNPSLTQAAFQKNAARYGMSSARADFFPEISGQIGTSRTDSRWPARGEEWDAGVTLSWPLFEGGLKTAQLERAMSQLRQLEANERSIRDGVIVGLEEAWAEFNDAVESVGVRGKFLDAAQERSKIAEAQYSLGLIQYDNWTIIQDDLVNAKTTLLSTQVNALLAQASWIQAKGETLEYVD